VPSCARRNHVTRQRVKVSAFAHVYAWMFRLGLVLWPLAVAAAQRSASPRTDWILAAAPFPLPTPTTHAESTPLSSRNLLPGKRTVEKEVFVGEWVASTGGNS
jgi:hypothetical protein